MKHVPQLNRMKSYKQVQPANLRQEKSVIDYKIMITTPLALAVIQLMKAHVLL